MKGNQGLEALAALCGGVTKAEEGTGSSGNAAMSALMVPHTVSPHVQAMASAGTPYAVAYSPGGFVSSSAAACSTGVAEKGHHQWQQAMVAQPLYGSVPPPVAAFHSASGFHQPVSSGQNSDGNSSLLSIQQLALFHYIQAQAAAQCAQQKQAVDMSFPSSASSTIGSVPINPNSAMAIFLAGQAHQLNNFQASQVMVSPNNQFHGNCSQQAQQQAQPVAHQPLQQSHCQNQVPTVATLSAHSHAQVTGSNNNHIKPLPSPQFPSGQSPSSNTHSLENRNAFITNPSTLQWSGPVPIAASTASRATVIASNKDTHNPSQSCQPLTQSQSLDGSVDNCSGNDDALGTCSTDGKKQLKRAANRRSAQLSRKRKKLFIEELRDENDELRRKEQILQSIPDLIVVFDSGGKLLFVSHSAKRFLDFTPIELEGSSFWDRLCPESVRLLKAAFMDSLAARQKDCDTAPLGSGSWKLRLADRDGSHKLVTLNGVVHFSGDTPECVCSIRPQEDDESAQRQPKLYCSKSVSKLASFGDMADASCSKASPVEPKSNSHPPMQNFIKHQQSVVSNRSAEGTLVKTAKALSSSVSPAADARASVNKAHSASVTTRRSGGRGVAQISDGDSSIFSESGSDE